MSVGLAVARFEQILDLVPVKSSDFVPPLNFARITSEIHCCSPMLPRFGVSTLLGFPPNDRFHQGKDQPFLELLRSAAVRSCPGGNFLGSPRFIGVIPIGMTLRCSMST